MKIFKVIQQNFEMFGIQPTSFNVKNKKINKCGQRYPFNVKNSITLLCIGQYAIASTLFLVLKSRTLKEFADSLYISATAILIAFNFAMFVLEASNIFQLIANFESAIVERRFTILC